MASDFAQLGGRRRSAAAPIDRRHEYEHEALAKAVNSLQQQIGTLADVLRRLQSVVGPQTGQQPTAQPGIPSNIPPPADTGSGTTTPPVDTLPVGTTVIVHGSQCCNDFKPALWQAADGTNGTADWSAVALAAGTHALEKVA